MASEWYVKDLSCFCCCVMRQTITIKILETFLWEKEKHCPSQDLNLGSEITKTTTLTIRPQSKLAKQQFLIVLMYKRIMLFSLLFTIKSGFYFKDPQSYMQYYLFIHSQQLGTTVWAWSKRYISNRHSFRWEVSFL